MDTKLAVYERITDQAIMEAFAKPNIKERSERLRSFWQRWNRLVWALSGGDLTLSYSEDDDGNCVAVYIAKSEWPNTPLQEWEDVPELVLIGGDDCWAIWPQYPKVTGWKVTTGTLRLLNQHAAIPGQEWLADSVAQASPKVTRSASFRAEKSERRH